MHTRDGFVVVIAVGTRPSPPQSPPLWTSLTSVTLRPHNTVMSMLSTAGLSPVLAATDWATVERMAIKVLSKAAATSPAARSSLAREVAVLRSGTGTPGVVAYRGVAEDAAAVYLV